MRLCFLAGELTSLLSLSFLSCEREGEVDRAPDRCRGRPRRPSSTALSLCRRWWWCVGLRGCGLFSISTSEPSSPLLRPLSLLAAGGTFSRAGAAFFVFLSSSPQREIRTGWSGRLSLSTSTLAIFCRTDWPDFRCPNMVCLPFRCSHGSRVMKNLRKVC